MRAPRRLTARRRLIAAAGVAVVLGVGLLGLEDPGSQARCQHRGPACVNPHAPRKPRHAIFVAQQARGSRTGASCPDARAVAWLDRPAAWKPGRGHIRPGATVALCGTISSPLRILGGGGVGSPITIYWEPGATLSSPDWDGGPAIDTKGHGYLTFDGGVNGSIQATEEGTGLADQGVASQGIFALGCTGCMFENLTIENLYRHTSPADTSVDQTMDDGIVFSGSNIKIAHDIIHDVGWALFSRWSNGDRGTRIYDNDIFRVDHGFAATASGTVGPMYFYDNHVHGFANWDASSSGSGLPYHHDGLHCFGPEGGPPPTYTGFYIYDNRFDGRVGRRAPTAQIFMEGGSGPNATPCASGSSRIAIFNNVIGSSDYDTSNTYLETVLGGADVYNNTIIGASKTENVGGCGGDDYTQPGSEIRFQNNLLSTCDILMAQSVPGVFATGSPDYNVYANGGVNAFACDGRFFSFRRFRRWRACVHRDRHSRRVENAKLNDWGVPLPGSVAIGSGLNLTFLCKGPLVPLCTDIVGRRRARRGPWNVGAY